MNGLGGNVVQEYGNHQDRDQVLRHPHVKPKAESEEQGLAQGGFGRGLGPPRLNGCHQEKDGGESGPKSEARKRDGVHGRMAFHSTFKAHSSRVAISRAPRRVKCTWSSDAQPFRTH